MRDYDEEQKQLLNLIRENINPTTLFIADLLNKYSEQNQSKPLFNVSIREVSDVEQK